MKTTDKEIKLYFKQIRMMLPIYSKREKDFLSKFRQVVYDYIEENPDCTYDDIAEHFESPADVAYNYISSMDQEEILNRLSTASTVKKAVAIIVSAVIIALIVAVISEWVMLFNLHQKSQNAIITKEVTVIE